MKTKTKANLQRIIGVISGVLLIVSYAGEGIFGVIVFYQLAHDPDLLHKFGYEPNQISYNGFYEGVKFSFHVFGLLAIVVYLVFIFLKKSKATLASFCICAFYALTITIFNITNLSPEARARGYTIGGWIGHILPWLIKYIIEMALLIQGYFGLLNLKAQPEEK